MNMYFIDIFEKIKSDQFDDATFTPDDEHWGLAKAWYSKFSSSNQIADRELLNLLYYFYIHENLDYYDSARFSDVAIQLNETYGVSKERLLEMFIDFREFVFKR